MNPRRGEIYLIKVIYPDQNGWKIRPGVVVSPEDEGEVDVIAVSVSTAVPRSRFDVVLENWKEAGLDKPSIARTSKILTVSSFMLKKRLGELTAHDLERVTAKCRELFM